jgi:mitochondrial fission protein ELM1
VLRAADAVHGVRAVVTPSRRTGEAAKRILANAFTTGDWGRLWDETGPNPYLGILGLSERLIVTGESVSMISEALATGRPVHILRLEGNGRRHEAFLARMVRENLVSEIQGDSLDWGFAGQAPINATAEPARRIREMLARRGAVAGLPER